MVHLSDYEKGVLDGKEGKLKQVCEDGILFAYVPMALLDEQLIAYVMRGRT
jgi:hypothetical protein